MLNCERGHFPLTAGRMTYQSEDGACPVPSSRSLNGLVYRKLYFLGGVLYFRR